MHDLDKTLIRPADCQVKEGLQLEAVRRTIWLTRPDLRALFGDDPEGFEYWLIHQGRQEYEGLREQRRIVPEARLDEPAEGAFEGVEPVFTRFMRSIWAHRPDLQQAFDISRPSGQEAMVCWYFLNGVRELGLAAYITERQWGELQRPVPVSRLSRGRQSWLGRLVRGALGRTGRARALSWIEATVWQHRADLQQAFDLGSAEGVGRYREWFARQGWAEYGLYLDEGDAAEASARRPAEEAPAGVNLIGYVQGQFGIGEDVRMAAEACKAAGIPFSIYNVQPGHEVELHREEAEAYVSSQLAYAVNVFCTTGIETARLAAVHGSRLFRDRYCIGFWPWELPCWPEEWAHAYDLVDEVWASSRYTYQALQASSPRRVRLMPMAVSVADTAGLDRSALGLPQGPFLFVFAFDFLSSVARKNPAAVIDAFHRAFARDDPSVGLVIKAMRAGADASGWQQLLDACGDDDRIRLMTGTLAREEILDLYRACDCYVSLHRAEGFGRGMAEAMLLGRPVIATGYSGNADFVTPATAEVVDYRLEPIAAGAYPYAAGQVWAEPDREDAAQAMRRIREDPAHREALAEQGRAYVQAHYTANRVGALYADALASLMASEAEA